jgi:DNA-binding beta-propeller fold protein YncE
VSVISGRTNTVTAAIPVGRGPFGVAANPNTNTIYVANQLDSTVSVLTACTK